MRTDKLYLSGLGNSFIRDSSIKENLNFIKEECNEL